MAALLRLRSSLCRRSAVSLAFARHVSASPPAGATLPVGSSSNQTALVQMPSPAYIAQEELDVDLPPRENVRLAITDRAAEVCVSSSLQLFFSSFLSATAGNIDPNP